MHAVKKSTAALLALIGMTGQLVAAPACATNGDVAAFRTAAVQQELMVAGFMCNDMDAYNKFVVDYRPELQKSDKDLMNYFIRRGGEAGYDTFKTKMANLSSLSDSMNGPAYCASMTTAFAMAQGSHQPLADFVAAQPLIINLPQQSLCAAKTMEASTAPPVKIAAQ